jgi:hypothetical protein
MHEKSPIKKMKPVLQNSPSAAVLTNFSSSTRLLEKLSNNHVLGNTK